MSTQEDRIVSLERKVAALELRRMYNEGMAQENTPPAQGRNLREINENMTILLGVIGEQGLDIRAVKEDLSAVKEDLSTFKKDVDKRFNSVDLRFNSIDLQIAEVKQDIGEVKQSITSIDGKFEQVLQQLSMLTKKPE